MIRRLLRRCDYPGCRSRGTVTGAFERRRAGSVVVKSQKLRLCDAHAGALATIAMRGREARIRVIDAATGEESEYLGRDAAARRLALVKGIPLRQARRELDQRRGR